MANRHPRRRAHLWFEPIDVQSRICARNRNAGLHARCNWIYSNRADVYPNNEHVGVNLNRHPPTLSDCVDDNHLVLSRRPIPSQATQYGAGSSARASSARVAGSYLPTALSQHLFAGRKRTLQRLSELRFSSKCNCRFFRRGPSEV